MSNAHQIVWVLRILSFRLMLLTFVSLNHRTVGLSTSKNIANYNLIVPQCAIEMNHLNKLICVPLRFVQHITIACMQCSSILGSLVIFLTCSRAFSSIDSELKEIHSWKWFEEYFWTFDCTQIWLSMYK